jgi:hypothetical protein
MRPTYANVVATACLFVALGGTAWAVAANSVGTTDLKRGAVTTRKVAGGAVTGGKLVPLDPRVVVVPVDTAQPCAPRNSGQFCEGWRDYGRGYAPAAYYRDRSGIVHLEGSVETDGSPTADLTLFYLPRSYRPRDGARTASGVTIGGDGSVQAGEQTAYLSLDGIAFRP